MERISTKKLPPIFKMSVLWNILPYYGHIHRWRRLPEKINTKTKDIWDQNREQLMYIGRDFKREIEFNRLKESASHLRPNRSWLDLFSLSLSSYFYLFKFDFTTLIDNLCEDEVIIIDSHDGIFKGYQIHFWSKERISDILPAIKCPSFKSETKTFKTTELDEMRKFIDYQNHTKSIVIEKSDKELSINLVYGNIVKLRPNTSLEKLKERYKLWKISDCACKPKKIRAQVKGIENLKIVIDELKWISNIKDAKIWMYIDCENYKRSFSKYDTMVFNHSYRWMNDNDTNFIFTGNTLMVVYKGNSYNFRLDQRTKKSKHSYIKGKI